MQHDGMARSIVHPAPKCYNTGVMPSSSAPNTVANVKLFNHQEYPAHLYEPTRLTLAAEILEKELTKQGWERQDAAQARSLIDFWDTFHAIREVAADRFLGATPGVTRA
jgi:hypothetical protein